MLLVMTDELWIVFKGMEYTTKYRLEYQREDDGRWFRYRNHNGSEASDIVSSVVYSLKYFMQYV